MLSLDLSIMTSKAFASAEMRSATAGHSPRERDFSIAGAPGGQGWVQWAVPQDPFFVSLVFFVCVCSVEVPYVLETVLFFWFSRNMRILSPRSDSQRCCIKLILSLGSSQSPTDQEACAYILCHQPSSTVTSSGASA